MKKFAKMSLVAAIAVTGTVATAQPLAEAIKNVDVSGTVVYRYDDKAVDNTAGDRVVNRYKAAISLKSKVTDDVVATTRFIAGSDANGFATLDTNDNGDQNVDVQLSQVFFTYTGVQNTAISAGKLGIQTPWTNAIDSDGNEATGTGINVVSTWGPVTATAGYFNQTNLDDSTTLTSKADSGFDGYDEDEIAAAKAEVGSTDLIVAGLLGSFAGVNAEVWYLDSEDTLDSVYAGLNYKFNAGPVAIGLDGKYTTVELDDEADDGSDDDLGNFELGVTAKMGIFNAGVAYAESDEDGAGIIMNVAKNGQIGYSVDLSGTDDSEMWMFDLGAQVTDKLHIGLNWDEIEDQTDNSTIDDHEEAMVQFTYKHAKNLSAYVRLADGEDNGKDYNRGRLQIEYKY